MPHVLFNVGVQTGTGDFAARQLIPGVEPGMGVRNIFAQQRTKKALLIRDAYLEVISMDEAAMLNDGNNIATYYLKLSQEAALDPGFLLPVAQIGYVVEELDATAASVAPVVVNPLFNSGGSIWAPLYVGVRIVEKGSINLDVDLHLDYDIVDVPWQEWFMMWEFLDGITNNAREHS